jgi:hypothetical protein
VAFYSRVAKEAQHSLNDTEIQEFFPLEHVVGAVLDIYQDLFGLKFIELQTCECASSLPDHPLPSAVIIALSLAVTIAPALSLACILYTCPSSAYGHVFYAIVC